MSRILTDKKVAALQVLWETDPRKGFTWLIRDHNLRCTPQALRKWAVRYNWTKKVTRAVTAPVTGEVTETVTTANAAVESNQENSNQENSNQRVTVTKPKKTKLPIRRELMAQSIAAGDTVEKTAKKSQLSPRTVERIRSSPEVKNRIKELIEEHARQNWSEKDMLMALWTAQATTDINEIVQLRRVACPFCWSKDHSYQMTPMEYHLQKEKYDRKVQAMRFRDLKAAEAMPPYPPYDGEWYDPTKPPNEHCPNCRGQGVEKMFLQDSRKLSPAARTLYSGVAVDLRGQLTAILEKRAQAAENLAKALGLFKENEEKTTVNVIAASDLNDRYARIMREAADRDEKMREDRGIVDVEPLDKSNNDGD